MIRKKITDFKKYYFMTNFCGLYSSGASDQYFDFKNIRHILLTSQLSLVVLSFEKIYDI